ncbi:hypothetical protein DFP72DRAFT_1162577 [Ephemerocybe angulata]|uniref:Nephrocystin 3-like N-terminal domain-containing protein n=1 Tax=Ephemerocybe angulata TaxID=980116 RepID=A0A8H6IHX3_9AGAR|nr:hypothetical protein DFP72DRAFT_1162577 [Tulosesus angulatus]
MANAAPSRSATIPVDYDGTSSPRSLPAASGGLDTSQGLASISPEGTSQNFINNYFAGPVAMNKVKSATNVSMGSNDGTINQNSGASELEEESYLAALDFLSKHMAEGAIHDSRERCDAPKCLPATRVAVQDEIHSWITDGHKDMEPKQILWVTGPAGTGKTAIMGSIAERCKAEGMLAATFFFSSFSGSAVRRLKTHLVSTLAYQLLQHQGLAQVGQFRTRMSQAIRRDPAILQKRLQAQLDELIMLPFRQGAPTGTSPMSQHRMAIIIDGLDECDRVEKVVPVSDSSRKRRTKEDEQIEILSAILHAATDPSFPFLIVIASRPELAIREFFSTGLARDATRELFLDDKYNPDADIRLFYDSMFSSIRRRFKLSPEWPSMREVLRLVADASGQFIYAATVMRFIEGPPLGTQDVAPAVQGLRTPHQRLVRILELRKRVHTPNVRPLEPLDILYDSVVRTCSEPLLSIKWLRAICIFDSIVEVSRHSNLHHGVWRFPPTIPARLLRLWMEQSPGDEVYAIGPLSSLLYIPSDPNCDQSYSFYHKSFVDFFEDKSRCADLFVPKKQIFDFLSFSYFQNMDDNLDRIPADLVYHTLNYSRDRDMFPFSSKDAFKTAKGAMLSCDAPSWVHHFTITGMGGPDHNPRYIIALMFYAVHVWCPKIRCRQVCKRWRGAILDVTRRKGWSVPSALNLFRDGRIRHYTIEEMPRFFNVPRAIPGLRQTDERSPSSELRSERDVEE